MIAGRAWTDLQLGVCLRTAAGQRFFPGRWLTCMTGMRRNEVLGLKWTDIDTKKKRLALNRGLVAVGYELHQTRGKTRQARRSIDLDDTTISVLEGWRAFQAAEFAAVGITNDEGWVFTDGDGNPIHPHALYQSFRRIVANADIPPLRFHDLRHTHGRSEEHTSELQSLMRISYAVFCLKKKKQKVQHTQTITIIQNQ